MKLLDLFRRRKTLQITGVTNVDYPLGITIPFHVEGKNAAGNTVAVTGVTVTATNATASVNDDGTNGHLTGVAAGPAELVARAGSLSSVQQLNFTAPAPDVTPVSLHIELP